MVTPPIEDNVVRVSISNELVNSTLQDEELQGMLTIPNDDLDYLDYVEAVTEGGDTEGPFTAVQLDFTQLNIDYRIDLYTRYSYLSNSIDNTRTSETSYLLTNTMFQESDANQTPQLANNKALIRISPYDSNGYFRITYLTNKSGEAKTVVIGLNDRYAIIDLPATATTYNYFHYCATTSNDDLGDVIVMDASGSDNLASVVIIRNTIYHVYVQTQNS